MFKKPTPQSSSKASSSQTGATTSNPQPAQAGTQKPLDRLMDEFVREFQKHNPGLRVRLLPPITLDDLIGPFGGRGTYDEDTLRREVEVELPSDCEAATAAVTGLPPPITLDDLGPFGGRGTYDEDTLNREVELPADCEPATAAVTDLPPSTPYPTAVQRWNSDSAHVTNRILDEVFDEVQRAVIKHRSMVSPHEGYAVIKEEFEELWAEIKKQGGGLDAAARKEAVQVAAMAVRYLLDIDPR